MILTKGNAPLKEVGGQLYIYSHGINKKDRLFCDYSKEENTVEVESQKDGERSWFHADAFFHPYAITDYEYIGIYDNKEKSILTYKLGNLISVSTGSLGYLAIELIPTGLKRPFTKDDIPFQKDGHVLALPDTSTPTPKKLTDDEIKELNRLEKLERNYDNKYSEVRALYDAMSPIYRVMQKTMERYKKDMDSYRSASMNIYKKRKSIDNGRTCQGCSVSSCLVDRTVNNLRCDKFEDGLPF